MASIVVIDKAQAALITAVEEQRQLMYAEGKKVKDENMQPEPQLKKWGVWNKDLEISRRIIRLLAVNALLDVLAILGYGNILVMQHISHGNIMRCSTCSRFSVFVFVVCTVYHNSIGRNYIGDSYICHNYIGHNFVGHNYIGHDYIGP